METADKDGSQRSKDDVSRRSIANMLPEMVAFLLAFGNVFEKATLNLYLIYSSCEELHPFEVDCGIDSQDDANVQVGKTTFSSPPPPTWFDMHSVCLRLRLRLSLGLKDGMVIQWKNSQQITICQIWKNQLNSWKVIRQLLCLWIAIWGTLSKSGEW